MVPDRGGGVPVGVRLQDKAYGFSSSGMTDLGWAGMLSPWRSADFKYLIRRGLCSECVSLVAALDLVCPRASSGYFLPSALTLTICEATSEKPLLLWKRLPCSQSVSL